MMCLAGRAMSDMSDDPHRRACAVLSVEVSPDQAEFETNGETAERETKNIHFIVGRAGRKEQAYEAKHCHHRADDDRTRILVHLSPPGLARYLPRSGLAHFDPDQRVPFRNGARAGDD